jgi:hypothetical protein
MTTSGPAPKPAGRRSAGSRTSTRPRRAAGSPPGGGAPSTAPPVGAQSTPPDDIQELQQEIEDTREQLGQTVEQLVAKADVRARARGKAAELTGRVKDQAGQARAQAAARAGTVGDQLVSKATSAGQRAAYLGAAAREQVSARAAPVWEAAPEPARQAVAKGASTTRQHRVPLVVAAGMLVVGLLAIRWWRTR